MSDDKSTAPYPRDMPTIRHRKQNQTSQQAQWSVGGTARYYRLLLKGSELATCNFSCRLIMIVDDPEPQATERLLGVTAPACLPA